MSVTWPEAKAYCESQGGYLATITSKEENDFIFSRLGGSSYALWIGGTDAAREGTWAWVNNEPWGYANWDAGEPNNAEGNEDSLQMVGTGKWNDNNSDSKIWFSCEWNSTSTPPSSSQSVNLIISTVSPGRYRLLGTLVDANGQPACGLALASGRCVFTCGPGSPRCEGGTDSLAFGQFDLTDLPTEPNGTLNLQTFVSGSAPGLQVVKPDGSVQLVSGAASRANSHTLNTTITETGPGRYRLLGTLLDANNQPACGLVLASGRCMFSCGSGSPRCEGGTSSLAFGQFDLTDLPTEANGTLNLQTFVAGSMPGLEVVQPPSGTCSYTLTPTRQTFDYPGGQGKVDVATQTGCAWTAQSNNDWITITAGASGTGPGQVTYTVASNLSSQRRGALTIAGQTLTVSQGPRSDDGGGGGH